MEIQPIVIGTAGHIDHGKSTLVRALTGIDPDRLKEEKQRGLTIDLGFAPLELPDGRVVGIVDVPGHERFIRNMVAGATGIDLVVLVVAADDGMMPQTREHLQIMELLGVQQGLIALTKVDAVDPELVELAAEDVRAGVAGTFLAEAPLFRVSAISGAGLDAFRAALFEAAGRAEPRSAEGVFRMPIQRVFSRPGFGTVVTGIPVSGVARPGDSLEVLPLGKKAKVRGLNAYKEKALTVRAGHSSALNLSDIDYNEVERGNVVATPGFFQPRVLVAARLFALRDLDRPIQNRMPIRLHTGTSDPPGEVILLDRESIPPGESGLVQLRLKDPVVCAPGDRFVLRQLSPVITLGGGAILEESRHRLKRFKGFVLEELSHQEESLASPAALLESELRRRGETWHSTEEVAVLVKWSKEEVRGLLARLEDEGRVRALKDERWIHEEALAAWIEKVKAALARWFEARSHRTLIEVIELRKALTVDAALLGAILDAMVVAGDIELLPGGRVRPAQRKGGPDAEFEAFAGTIAAALEEARFQPPSPAELASLHGRSSEDVERALEYLRDSERVDRVGGELHLARTILDDARARIVENCQRNGKLEIPELRDGLQTSRKFLIPLLEYFDAQGLTIRQGGHRVLRQR